MPCHVLSRSEHGRRVFVLRGSLYRLINATETWNKLFFNTLLECGLAEMNRTPCVFIVTNAVVLCYVHNLTLFAADEYSLDNLYHKIGTHFSVKDRQKPNHFLRLDLISNCNDIVSLSQSN